MRHHLKHMLIAGVVVLGVLLVLRVDLRTALPTALALACPLGMVGMMWLMRPRAGAGGGHDETGHGHEADRPGAGGEGASCESTRRG